MKQDEKIRASLNRIQMPEDAKRRIWQSIAAADEREAGSMSKRGWIFATGAAVLAAAVAAVVLISTAAPEQSSKAAYQTPDDAQQVAVVEPAPTAPATDKDKGAADETPLPPQDDTREGNGPAGGDGGSVFLTNLKLDNAIDVPELPGEIAVYENVPIKISEKEMRTIEENATAHGWQNIDMDGTEHEGLYFIWSRDMRGDILNITEQEHHELRVQFLQESGLADLLESKGMTLNLDESDENGVVWSEVNGRRASGFVRLGFEEGKIVGDCKIWAIESRVVAVTELIPLEDAAKNAFFIYAECDPPNPDDEYVATQVQIKYISGIPYYHFHIPRPGMRCFYTAIALAVDESVIMDSDLTKKAYEHFLEYGF